MVKTESRIEMQEKAYMTYQALSADTVDDAVKLLKDLAPIYRQLPESSQDSEIKQLRISMYKDIKNNAVPSHEALLAYVDMLIK